MQQSVASKVMSGLSANGTGTSSITAGSGIIVNNGVVSVDNGVVATDTDLATKTANKVSASDNNFTFSGVNPKFSNALTVQSKVLLGNNSGFGIVCRPESNNLTDYSLLFDSNSTMLNKKNTGSGECAICLGNNNKIAVVDMGVHNVCSVNITPTSVNGERERRRFCSTQVQVPFN